MCGCAGSRRDLAAAGFPERGTQTHGNLRHPMCGSRALRCLSLLSLRAGGSVPPTQPHFSPSRRTPRLCRRLARDCAAPHPLPRL